MNEKNPPVGNRNTIWIILAIINLILIIIFFSDQQKIASKDGATSFTSSTIESSSTPEINQLNYDPQPTTTSTSINETKLEDDFLIILSMHVDQKSSLFIYHPQQSFFIPIFTDNYERIHPSLSGDQNNLAYSAKKNGYWDIFILDLKTGDEIRITDTPEYEGAPTWSPDNQYLAYETYKYGNLDIFIQGISDLSAPPIELTSDKNAQFSPAWSPKGEEIAFVSTQDGDEEIYLAKLDTLENRFDKITDRPNLADLNPEWSLDGEKLFWTSEVNGFPIILNSPRVDKYNAISEVTNGTDIAFSKNAFSFIQSEANQDFLVIKDIVTNELLFPYIKLPGNVHGIIQLSSFSEKDYLINSLSENPELSSIKDSNLFVKTRFQLVKVNDLELGIHYLHENALNPFNHFRTTISDKTGWDFLYQLDKTYIPLTEPSAPGMAEEWLFSGRAFEFNPLSTHAGLVVTIKEERSGQTYWRVLIKTRYQDGSQGLPIRQMPFDLASRYNNDPQTYETGGKKGSIPEGYWVDITEIGQNLQWERVPGLGNWQRYFEATRFNQFVFTEGLDWQTAMKQIYPFEALKTPSPLPTNSLTPTSSPTIRYFRSPTIFVTPTETLVPTYRPTWTPKP